MTERPYAGTPGDQEPAPTHAKGNVVAKTSLGGPVDGVGLVDLAQQVPGSQP